METIKEHYIPQFIMRNFADETGRITVIDKQAPTFHSFTCNPSKVLFEDDLYETKNIDGTYFNRNAIENRFSQIESYVSGILEHLKDESNWTRDLTAAEDVSLGLFLALQLVRLPYLREIIGGSDTDVQIHEQQKK